ncbi:DoxX family protein [Saccharomonospora iraqiensis]|uniref:DoxX family protein n=1 Tax=Saccharomonospora iraqiensis TaxID=52698 RepID=UPI00022DED73|nr:DoxX family protein [Saccharomonospora iraqiensis]
MILRRVARPLLASIFIAGGINALRQKEAHAEAAKPLLDKTVGEKAGELPSDPVTLVQVDAAVKIAAGTMLTVGVLPRISSVLLLGSLVPTTVVGHPFWEEQDQQKRQQELTEFLKNASLAGGLLISAVDTGGKPSLGWRTRHAAEEVGHQVQGKTGEVQRRMGAAQGKAGLAVAKATKASEQATARAAKRQGRATGMAKGKGKALKAAKKGAGRAKSAATHRH